MTGVTPHRTRPVRRVGGPRLVGMVAMVAVTGCTGGGATPPASSTAAPPSTTSSTSSATTTSTPAPPSTSTTAPTTPTADPVIAKIPAAARGNTAEGASSFTAFYFKQINVAFREGSPDSLNGLSSSACKTCLALRRGVAEVKAAGHHYGGDLTKVKYSSPAQFTSEIKQVLVNLQQLSVPILDKNGRQVGRTRSAQVAFLATLEFDRNWTITRLQRATA